jgi:hypothetical protein
MHLDCYQYLAKNDYYDYEFVSDGPKGKIRKAVRFTKVRDGNPGFYNLGFGDIDEISDTINDQVVTDNGDRDKVLATVALTVMDFTNIHGSHYIIAQGSSPSRTRLYQIGISRLWNEISADFDVFGFADNHWHAFQHNVNYEAFLVKRK